MMIIQLFIKRLLDITASALLIILLSPLLLWLYFTVKSRLGAPAFFTQTRIGKHSRPFTLIKFRTMRDAVDADGTPLDDAQRMTEFGTWLRATSLDELPELWNILRGDMSLVGPRPLLPAYLPHYTAREATRHTMRPGITGLAQVSGRNAISWDARLELDAQYVEQFSLLRDIIILWRTARIVITKEGISADGEATMTRFDDERIQGKSHGAH